MQLQSAVDSLSTNWTEAQCIFIYPGTYSEQVYVSARVAILTIYGSTTDTTSYSSNTVTITQGKSQDDSANNNATATVRAWAAGLTMYNINLVNTRGMGGFAGACIIALSAMADQQSYYGVSLSGYPGKSLEKYHNPLHPMIPKKKEIKVLIDFIFGQRVRAWFENADIDVIDNEWITAKAYGRGSEDKVSYYLFNNFNVAAASGYTISAGASYFGRPWRNYSRAVFQNTALIDVIIINSARWSLWSSSTSNKDHVYYMECL
ncbi:hypothetical protein RUND412_001288 [Rhizina undulata]